MATKLVPLALVVLALAAVPVALGDDGTNPPPTGTTAPTATQGQAPADAGQGGQAGNAVRLRLQILRDRIQLVELRFARHCGSGANGAPQQCVQFAQKIEAGLQKLDSKVQAKIQTLQSCTTGSTDQSCRNADKKIALLQQVDQRLQTLIQKVQSWLGGSSSSSSSTSGGSSTSESGLDQAAAGLGQLTQQVGGTTP
jgi:hypothetical protein